MTSAVSNDPVQVQGSTSVKGRQQAMWASGDFAVIGTTLQIVGELLCEAVDLQAGERVLDVAAGNGNATLAEAADVRGGERVLDVAAGNGNASLAAARRFASVVSTDYVSTLLDGPVRSLGSRSIMAGTLFCDFVELALHEEGRIYCDSKYAPVRCANSYGCTLGGSRRTRRTTYLRSRALRIQFPAIAASRAKDLDAGSFMKVINAQILAPA